MKLFPRGRLQAFDDPEEAYKRFVARQPMGRLGTAEEIAAAVAFFASDEVIKKLRGCKRQSLD